MACGGPELVEVPVELMAVPGVPRVDPPLDHRRLCPEGLGPPAGELGEEGGSSGLESVGRGGGAEAEGVGVVGGARVGAAVVLPEAIRAAAPAEGGSDPVEQWGGEGIVADRHGTVGREGLQGDRVVLSRKGLS